MAVLWNLVDPSRFNPVGQFQQGYQGGQKFATDRERKSILSRLGEQGGMDYAQGAQELARSGDLQGAGTLAQLSQIGVKKQPSSVQEYEFAQSQGFQGSLLDYQTAKAKAGASRTSVNIKNPLESEYDKTTGRGFAEQNIELIKGAQSARGKIATLDRLGQLISDPNIYTGAGANLVTDAKRMAKAIGIDVGDVSGAEAVRAISNQFALELRNPAGGAGMPGAMSDKDREFLQQSVPGLQQSPEGNKLIIDYARRVANRSVEVDRLRREYIAKNRRLDEGFYQALAQYSEANPLFPEAGQGRSTPPPQNGGGQQGGGPVRVQSPQQRDALPPGTQYIAPDGSLRTKR